MIVNQQALRGIYTSFKVIFQKAFEQNETLWQRIATLVPSETGEENYKWLGKIPHMREWIGDRQIQNLSASDYTIKNKDFELTVSVPRSDIEDDRDRPLQADCREHRPEREAAPRRARLQAAPGRLRE